MAIESTANVVCRNPKTGQVLSVSAKAFYSVYLNKGFEIANAQNVDAALPAGRRTGEKKRSEPTSVTGSAADIAAGLGLDNAGDPMTFSKAAAISKKSRADNADSSVAAGGDAEKDVTGSAKVENENSIDTDGSANDAGRESTKRDRGRSR